MRIRYNAKLQILFSSYRNGLPYQPKLPISCYGESVSRISLYLPSLHLVLKNDVKSCFSKP